MASYRRWNWSRRAGDFRRADGFVVSVPKSGRTWVRVLLQAYLTGTDDDRFRIDDVPSGAVIVFCHDVWEHRTSRRLGRKLLGRHLISTDATDKPLALLVRDPRDVFVSLYHQVRNRERRFAGTIGELLVDRTYGIAAIVQTLNRWRDEWKDLPRFRSFRYEDLRKNPSVGFSELLEHLGFAEIDPRRLDAAVAFSAFDNMKAREEKGFFGKKWLAPKDPSDPDSFKVRRGKVGGFLDELSPEEIEIADSATRALHPDFGYAVD